MNPTKLLTLHRLENKLFEEQVKTQVGRYRYGFNGKENDNDIKGGLGTQQDYGMRIYDPRVGRFLSVDPITKNFPMLTPYRFASNRPIDGVDLDGLEYLKSDQARIEVINGGVFLKVSNLKEVGWMTARQIVLVVKIEWRN
jgi:RHS repeat-associated protein